MKKKKICFAASSGGHYEQLMMLKPLMKRYDGFVLTEKTQYNVAEKDLKMRYLLQVNRAEKLFFVKMAANCFLSLVFFLKERPNIVICTGVLATIPMCLLVKLARGKLIYIESFAKVTSPTLTGKLLYKFADQFYVQWPQMLEIYPEATCCGGIY